MACLSTEPPWPLAPLPGLTTQFCSVFSVRTGVAPSSPFEAFDAFDAGSQQPPPLIIDFAWILALPPYPRLLAKRNSKPLNYPFLSKIYAATKSSLP